MIESPPGKVITYGSKFICIHFHGNSFPSSFKLEAVFFQKYREI